MRLFVWEAVCLSVHLLVKHTNCWWGSLLCVLIEMYRLSGYIVTLETVSSIRVFGLYHQKCAMENLGAAVCKSNQSKISETLA